jgi:hypothetical protein
MTLVPKPQGPKRVVIKQSVAWIACASASQPDRKQTNTHRNHQVSQGVDYRFSTTARQLCDPAAAHWNQLQLREVAHTSDIALQVTHVHVEQI